MISVCMAIYNGEKYIQEQLASILPQLGQQDELVLSDDGSTDQTGAILETFAQKDDRIKVLRGPQKGLVANFAFAIAQAQGDLIFLADQDDVWLPTKVAEMGAYFASHPQVDVVVSDLKIVDENLAVLEPSYFAYRQVKTGFVANILRNGYIGAGMAFRSSLKEQMLPIPPKVPMHDMWIGLLADAQKRTAWLEKPLTLYRRHGENASAIQTEASFYQQLRWRFNLCLALAKRLILKK